MTWEELKAYLKGKYFLIGLTFINEDGRLIEQYQTNGFVQELADDGLLKIIRNDGGIFQIPYDKDTIRQAEKGEYREKATGQIIKDPDFMMTWQIVTEENDDLEEIKKHGHIPAD
ncbi:MAG: hypothetical protein M3Y54_22460 [Bacteroidota bacterium]|nr:hypothetical protein [Bacteroidota bacterium]